MIGNKIIIQGENQKAKRIAILNAFILAGLMLLLAFCKTVVLTAPDNSTLIVTVNPPVIALGGQAIVKVVGFKASGTPIPDGTVIFFSTDIGTIESQKETTNGAAESVFKSSDNRSGIANITVKSGNATVSPTAITITIGTSGLSSLSITSDPPVLPVGGGSATIRVTALDATFNPLASIPVTLSTDAGQLNSGGNVLTTNAGGVVQDVLRTTAAAVVTARSGNISGTLTINVESNEDPTATFVFSPESPKVGQEVYFNASGSSDDDGTIVSYQWDFGDGDSGSGITTTHRYESNGSFNVVLVVRDNSGNQASHTQEVTVSKGSKPTATFDYSPTSPTVNETIYFNASESSDEDGTIESYSWDFGDGTKGSGREVTHKYSKDGHYKVLLTVTDDDGNTGMYSEEITIGENKSPTASFIFTPSSPGVNEDVHFDASDSSDSDGTIVSYEWDMGDGTTDTGVTVTHRYGSTGTYKVNLKVTDNSGNTARDEDNVPVTNGKSPTPSFEVSPTTPKVGEKVYFNASASNDEDGTIVSYEWDFGDGRSGSGVKVSHVYAEAATYRVTLAVTDDSGNRKTLTKDVRISEETNPTASFTYSPTSPTTSTMITFDASASEDPDGSIESWFWEFGDGYTGSGETVDHQYSSADTFTVKLTVIDDDGNSDSTPQSITVTATVAREQ